MTSRARSRYRRLALAALVTLAMLVGGSRLWHRLTVHVQSVVADGLPSRPD
jgi:hypothetical protein